MNIETERLVVRSIEKGDEKVFLQMAKDGSLTEVGFDMDCSEWIDDWINEAIELTKNDDPRADYIPCTIVDKTTDKIVGSVGCTYYEDTDSIGICYFIGADHRKNGYATEAVKAYTGYFFDHYNEKDIIATIKEVNTSSYKTAEGAGFKLIETKMYKDIDDDEEELYRFYVLER